MSNYSASTPPAEIIANRSNHSSSQDPDQQLREDMESQINSQTVTSSAMESDSAYSSYDIEQSVVSAITSPTFYSAIAESLAQGSLGNSLTYLSQYTPASEGQHALGKDGSHNNNFSKDQGPAKEISHLNVYNPNKDDLEASAATPVEDMNIAVRKSSRSTSETQTQSSHSNDDPIRSALEEVLLLVQFHWDSEGERQSILSREIISDQPKLPRVLGKYMNAGHWQVFLQAVQDLAIRNHRVGSLWLGLGIGVFVAGLAFCLYGFSPMIVPQGEQAHGWHIPVGLGMALIFAGVCLGIWGQANRQNGVLFIQDMQALCANASEQVAGVTFQFQTAFQLKEERDIDDEANLIFGLEIFCNEEELDQESYDAGASGEGSTFKPTPPPADGRSVGSEVVEVVYNRLKQSMLAGSGGENHAPPPRMPTRRPSASTLGGSRHSRRSRATTKSKGRSVQEANSTIDNGGDSSGIQV